MDFNEMAEGIQEAIDTVRLADRQLARISFLLGGKLQSSGIPNSTLREFKRELDRFNMRTGQWKY